MLYVIRAADGSYKRYPGDSLSSRYDDYGYTTWEAADADHYTSYDSAALSFHDDGKFSPAQGARVVGLELTPVELEERAVDCDKCEDGTVYVHVPGYYSRDEPCGHCGGTHRVKKVYRQEAAAPEA